MRGGGGRRGEGAEKEVESRTTPAGAPLEELERPLREGQTRERRHNRREEKKDRKKDRQEEEKKKEKKDRKTKQRRREGRGEKERVTDECE